MSSGILPGWSPSRASRNRWLEFDFFVFFYPTAMTANSMPPAFDDCLSRLRLFCLFLLFFFSPDEAEEGTIFYKRTTSTTRGGPTPLYDHDYDFFLQRFYTTFFFFVPARGNFTHATHTHTTVPLSARRGVLLCTYLGGGIPRAGFFLPPFFGLFFVLACRDERSDDGDEMIYSAHTHTHTHTSRLLYSSRARVST